MKIFAEFYEDEWNHIKGLFNFYDLSYTYL